MKGLLLLENINVSDELYVLAHDILNSAAFQQMQYFNHHKGMTTLEHSVHVAEKSLEYVRKHKIKCDKRALVVGCLLHDLFLYDYHIRGNRWAKMHAFTHPTVALRNAEFFYDLTDLEREIIKKHMWPSTIIPPTRKEAWIIVWTDKTCAIKETIQRKQVYKMLMKQDLV